MKTHTNRRKSLRYMDRRSGEDRRKVYSLNYFLQGGVERRTILDRRQGGERRHHSVIKPISRQPTLS